ncbi:MAG: hypothetical protein HY999_00955 [Nitrospinae bacterium]|nr:hypothetical protein [Nitrospinota bacterium]
MGMGIATDIKRLGEDIITSYDMRVKAMGERVKVVGELVRDTHNMVKGFQARDKERRDNLKAYLTKSEEDRLKDFKITMDDLVRCKEDRGKDLKIMIAEIKRFIVETRQANAKLMKQSREDRNKEVAELLERFAKDHEAMASELEKGLEKGERERLRDFGSMMSSIQKSIQDVINDTKGLIEGVREKLRNKKFLAFLEDFKTEREKMAANWQKLSEEMYKRRGGKISRVKVEADEEVKTVEEVVEARSNKKLKLNKKRGVKKI